MKTLAGLAVLVGLLIIGCSEPGRRAPVAANPYEARSGQPAESSPPPRARRGRARQPRRQPTAPKRSTSAAKTADVRDAGEYVVQLTLTEYSRMARRASAILQELTEIHTLVAESGDAASYQERWGELTAQLTKLHRRVLESGYPPPDVAVYLKESSLPALNEAIAEAKRVIEENTNVESGLSRCRADAEQIHAHLSQIRDE